MTALFLTCWMVLTLHFATNISREHYPAMSLAEQGRLAVDEYEGLHPDIFVAPDGHAYINNNPGVSVAAAVPLLVFRPVLRAAEAYGLRRLAASRGQVSADYDDPRPNRQRFYRQVRERGLDIKFGVVSAVTVAFFMAPLTAVACVVMFLTLRRLRLTRASAICYALLLVFGTPLFFRSGYLNHNHVLGLAVFGGFVLLWRPGAPAAAPTPTRLSCAGLLGGYAVFCDYSGIVPLAFLFSYAVLRLWRGVRPGRDVRAGWPSVMRGAAVFTAGAAVPLAALLFYQWSAFGNPLLPAQGLMPETQYSGHGYRGMSWPAADLIAANLFDLRFGLFAFCPALLLGIPGLWLAPSTWFTRDEKWCLAFFGAAFLLFCSANQFARLQWNTGVRYLVPLVPFLFVGVVAALERLPRRLAYAIAALTSAQAWALAMVRESVPESLARIWTNGFELPWLTVLGKMAPQYLPNLDGRPSPWPLFLITAAAVAGIWWWALRRKGAAGLAESLR